MIYRRQCIGKAYSKVQGHALNDVLLLPALLLPDPIWHIWPSCHPCRQPQQGKAGAPGFPFHSHLLYNLNHSTFCLYDWIRADLLTFYFAWYRLTSYLENQCSASQHLVAEKNQFAVGALLKYQRFLNGHHVNHAHVVASIWPQFNNFQPKTSTIVQKSVKHYKSFRCCKKVSSRLFSQIFRAKFYLPTASACIVFIPDH